LRVSSRPEQGGLAFHHTRDHGLPNRLERLSQRSLKKRPMYNAAAFMFPLESVLF
jgi:hypothetical protein